MRRPALAAALLACAPPRPQDPAPAAPAHVPADMSQAPAPPAAQAAAEPPAPPDPPDPPPRPADLPEGTPSPPRIVPPPEGLVDLRAVLPGACFDVRYATADNFTGAPLPGYEAPGAWLRAAPAAALARAQAALAPRGLVLLVHDAYRPLRASRAMVAWAERTGRRRLLDQGYIARRSWHNHGDTVDVALARAGTCEALDMGTPWDHLGPESHTERATGEALHNRRLLRDVLADVGFSPYPKEWWHFRRADPGAVPLDIPYRAP